MDIVLDKALQNGATTSSAQDNSIIADHWSKVFAEYGEVWGQDASPSAEVLIKQIEIMRDRLISAGEFRPNFKIYEAGYGYGRDLKALLGIKKTKIDITGIDESPVGQHLAFKNLKNSGRGKDAWVMVGDITKAVPLERGSYDYMLSHRVMHLLGTNGKLRGFLDNARDLLKDNGTAVISVRDERDFKPERMTRNQDGTVAYNDRPDHIISLWKTKDLVSLFEKSGFEVQEAIQSEEVESTRHPDEISYFTIIRATKKPELSA